MSTKSPAYQFLEVMWKHGRDVAAFDSWRQFNAALTATLTHAIHYGLIFHEDDFQSIHVNMRGGYWFGSSAEHFYSLAVKSGNTSACVSYEKWRGRKPYFLKGQRLFVGSRFVYNGESCELTSFSEERSFFTACSYKETLISRAISKRFKITREELVQFNKKFNKKNKAAKHAVKE